MYVCMLYVCMYVRMYTCDGWLQILTCVPVILDGFLLHLCMIKRNALCNVLIEEIGHSR